MPSVRLVARPDARMVEVPVEIEAELPREYEGQAVLAASGLPRKVKLKPERDAVRLSTAYRADQLVADIVKVVLKGSPEDVQKAQDAVAAFLRAVRERRQEGASIVVRSNGEGGIEVAEQTAAAPLRPGAPASTPAPGAEDPASLDRRVAQLELAQARIAELEKRVAALRAEAARGTLAVGLSGPGMERRKPADARPAPTRDTAVSAFADGLRAELRGRIDKLRATRKQEAEACNRAAALAAEAGQVLHVPQPDTIARLHETAAEATARLAALDRVASELEFYSAAEVPLASELIGRLERAPAPLEVAADLERLAKDIDRAGGAAEPRADWMKRAAALCGWEQEPPPATAVSDEEIVASEDLEAELRPQAMDAERGPGGVRIVPGDPTRLDEALAAEMAHAESRVVKGALEEIANDEEDELKSD